RGLLAATLAATARTRRAYFFLLMTFATSRRGQMLANGSDSAPEAIAIMAADPDHLILGDDAPATLPLLPVRNTVLFPGVVLPVTVTRKKSIRLIRKLASKNEKLVGVVAQRNPDADEPGLDDLHTIGTLARILKLIDQPDGQVTIIIQGQVRFQVLEEVSFSPQLTARVSYFEERGLNADNDSELVLLQSLREAASKVLELTPEIPPEARAMLEGIQSPAFLIQFLSSNVQLELPAKQALLELADPEAQARQLLEALLRQAELLEIKNDIRSKTHTGIDAQQREYFLRQQLKTLQDELGQGEGSPEQDMAGLRARAQEKKWPEAVGKHFEKELSKLARINQMSPDVARLPEHEENPGCRPLRARKGEGAHSGIPGGAEAETRFEGPDFVPLRPARRGQNQPGPQRSHGARAQVRAPELGRRARRGRDTGAPQNLRGRHARPHHRPDKKGRREQPGHYSGRD
nr:lon protease homolog 2, peroxisomal [Tanacetum cinerariifolium]